MSAAANPILGNEQLEFWPPEEDKVGKWRHEKATYVKLNWTKVRYIREAREFCRAESLAKLSAVHVNTIYHVWQETEKGGWKEVEVSTNG